MRPALLLPALGLCAVVMFNPPARACTAPPMEELQVHLAAVNAERGKSGRMPLALDPGLAQLAQAHACDMARRGYFSHTSPDGSTMVSRARRAGLSNYCSIGENIARGHADVPSAMASWLRSPGHRRNILDRDFTHVGFGRAPGAHWVQLFAGNC